VFIPIFYAVVFPLSLLFRRKKKKIFSILQGEVYKEEARNFGIVSDETEDETDEEGDDIPLPTMSSRPQRACTRKRRLFVEESDSDKEPG